ncbi:MAG: hypothetical protein Q4D38_08895 [Planctomycetia bacterium]|nr:hypothetical protein [Planctomycetia bacterium]
MILGPIFRRELTLAPRRKKMYVSRCVYTVSLLIITTTAWLILSGSQLVEDPGDMARFGKALFGLLAPMQLILAMFFSGIFAAGAVAQEKDRNTLVLLLMTRLNNAELVLGKLAATLLHLYTNLLAAAPVLLAILCFGGVDFAQILHCFWVTIGTILLSGALGATLAFWREQTFQAISMTVLSMVVWLGVCEGLGNGLLGATIAGVSSATLAEALSPWRAILLTTHYSSTTPLFPFVAAGVSFLLIFWTIVRVRVWNRGEKHRDVASVENVEKNVGEKNLAEKNPAAPSRSRSRSVWDNPILWREMRTRAYGRRAFLVRLFYVLIFAAAFYGIHQTLDRLPISFYETNTAASLFALQSLVPLALLSLALVNTQAVTSITGERDARALDLLLVTDLTPKEIVLGKLGGIFWNTREMWALPVCLILYFCGRSVVSPEIGFYLLGGFATLLIFSAMLGIHCGMTYGQSRSAVGVSLGTLFFLFVGVAVCLRMMLSLGGSFQAQIQPFLVFMAGGGLAMYLALGARNPSSAIGLASFGCPFATFYAMSALLMNYTLGVFLVVALAYGFTTAAMLIPAVYEFDVASSREGARDD